MQPLVIQIERTQERLADTCAFAKSPVRIGRNALSDLQLDESFVSQWHGVIRFDEAHTTYLDLGSTNPTLIDGKPIPRNVEVEVTETTDIRIGTLRLHLLRVPAPAELFGARRKTSFARAGAASFNNASATMFLGNVQALQAKPKTLHEPPAPVSRPIIQPNLAPPNHQLAASGARAPAVSVATGAHSGPARAFARELSPVGAMSLPEPAPGDVDTLYKRYSESRTQLLGQIRTQLEAAAATERERVADALLERYPELAHEPALRALFAELGLPCWRTGVPDTSDWLRRLTGGLFPPVGQASTANPALAMERIGEVLEVFSSAFIELRTAHSQFCDEMALEKAPDDSVLYSTADPRAVLAYLLNPDTTQSNKVTELARAMADFAVHQVALVSAVVEGARDVLQTLAPAALTGQGAEQPGASFIGKLLGHDQRALWTRYVTVYDETVDADRFTKKLFGRGFARKYYAITGGRRSLPMPRPNPSVRP